MSPFRAIVKVGGSLYDLPDLGVRLRRWLAAEFPQSGVVLIPGGGPTTDVIRAFDQCHALGEEAAHWLALRSLTLNAYFLAALLPQARVVATLGECAAAWGKSLLPIFDTYDLIRRDDRLPHRWSVTSDALAARVAIVAHAQQLVLLKSTTIPEGINWHEAGQRGLVDESFADVLREAPADLRVRAVDLRRT